MHMRDCSCAPILRFFSAASDGATAELQIQNAHFGQFRIEEGERRQLWIDLDAVSVVC